ncbi:MAG: hypothetical protein L6R37_005546 [Teloschistes peruensis]|nr:MAG: hypothetical protein L6R37_005546 [Teloschistes peruensis]
MTRYRQSPQLPIWLQESRQGTRPAEYLEGLEEEQRPTSVDVESYTQPFLSFITQNPTVFHAVDAIANRLQSNGFIKLSPRDAWADKIKKGGKYFVERNGSSIIAFVVGSDYKPGNGAAVIAAHVDALTTKVKPIPTKPTRAGYVQLGIAPYAGALNKTWWDRDLGIGGKVLVKDSKTGKIESKLVKLDWPIARIPTLAPHFGAPASDPHPNPETQMVPIIGLDNSDISGKTTEDIPATSRLGGIGAFTSTQPERLVKAIAGEMNISDYNSIINWELEVFDTQPAQLGGLDKEFIFAPRIDDKLCSYAAIEALIASTSPTTSDQPHDPPSAPSPNSNSIIKLVGCFDDEEIGSLLRQGARSNFLPNTIDRILAAFSPAHAAHPDLVSQTYANGFLISADVSHAVNPNYLSVYLENHAPRLNVGVAVQADPNGHTTTDSVSTAFLQRVADKCGSVLQVFQIRNDSRSGGTVGPMLSSAMGMRAIDAGVPQLSMHSIRATVGDQDPGLGVKLFKGFFDHFEEVDAEF